jgi:predicted nucleic acid-binding protein
MIFLDTNIISYYFNANNNVKEKLMEAVDDDREICTTVINIYEILKGFKWKNNKKEGETIQGISGRCSCI